MTGPGPASATPDRADPRGLMREAFAMDLGPEDCRTIFLDWMLGLPEGAGAPEIRAVLDRYAAAQPDHPMVAVLREGLGTAPRPRRRRRKDPAR
ncbi:MAG: hypothetical protein U1E40_10075 [Amaricoccus sp.]